MSKKNARTLGKRCVGVRSGEEMERRVGGFQVS
jgi:hypothetical protein